MNKTLRYILITLIAVVSASVYGADFTTVSDLPVVQLLGDDYYVYTTKKNESLFGVSRKFGWDDEILFKLNPTAVSPLKKGMKLYYPVNPGKNTASQEAAANRTIIPSDVTHIVKRGETVYSISSLYNVPVDRIYELNPDSKNGISAGQTILLRKASATADYPNEGKTIFYTVKYGDTLSQLSRDYDVSVASILKLNPGVSESNFKAGSNIKIPARGTGIKKSVETVSESNLNSVELLEVSKNDTWESLAAKLGVTPEVLKEANPNISELKAKEYLVIPRIDVSQIQKEVKAYDPRETEPDGIKEIYGDVHNIQNDTSKFDVRVAIVASNIQNKRDIEFIRGFLAGVDRFKREDFRITLKAINSADGSESVISQLDEFKPNIVFLTTDGDIPTYITEYAEVSQTPVVNTFDTRSTAYTENPYIVQLLTPSSLFNDNVASYTYDKYGERTIVFAGTPDEKDQLSEALLKLWNPERVVKTSIESLTPEYFGESGKYLVYLYPVKRDEVSKAMTVMNTAISQRPFADIDVLGRPNLIQFEESMISDFQKAHVSIPSRFCVLKDSEEYKEFLQRYKDMFHRAPVKSLPLFAAVGYDTSCYFIPALANARGDMNELEPSKGTVQNDFNLWRASNWSGFINPPVFMIDFTPFGTVEKNVINFTE